MLSDIVLVEACWLFLGDIHIKKRDVLVLTKEFLDWNSTVFVDLNTLHLRKKLFFNESIFFVYRNQTYCSARVSYFIMV